MLNFGFQDWSQIFDKYSNVWKNVSTISYTYVQYMYAMVLCKHGG